MNFIIYNASGEILRVGACPDEDFALQPLAGELAMEGLANPQTDAIDVATQTVVPGGRVLPPEPPVTYSQARAEMYPRVEEQLDMLWHAMDEDPTKRLEPFYSVVKAIKTAVPKVDDYVFDVGGQ